MITLIRKNIILKPGSVLLVFVLIYQMAFPMLSHGLSSGPSMPEVQSFEPVSTTQLVDPFTGDFNYNIPLMDVGGYPINLHYHAGIGMDQEASWVGLGWNISPGVINRNIRGIPDDFLGDPIEYNFNRKKNTHTTLQFRYPLENLETFGYQIPKRLINNTHLGISYDNYRGIGFDWGGGSISQSTADGVDVDLSLPPHWSNTFKYETDGRPQKTERERYVEIGLNSRRGLREIGTKTNHNGREVSHTTHSFALKQYTPYSIPQISSISANITIKAGTEFEGVFSNYSYSLGFSDYYVKEGDKTFTRNAYGYLNAQWALRSSVMDKSNNTVSFDKFTKYLNHSVHTYDYFSVSGQGIGGSFRPFRTQVGSIADHSNRVDSKYSASGFGFSGSYDFGAGNAAKVGFDVKPQVSLYSNGRWEQCGSCNDQTLSNLEFTKSRQLDEHSYFKAEGEITRVDQDYFDKIKGENVVKIAVDDMEFIPPMSPSFIYDKIMGNYVSGASPENISIDNPILREKREIRQQAIQYLTQKERAAYGIDRDIINHSVGSAIVVSDLYRMDHHVSEVTTIADDGSRYVYGLAAYGNTKDVSFAIGGSVDPYSCNHNGLVEYTSTDASLSNTKGIDNFYQSTKTPKHAYAYHLTAILSPDYADLTGNGPSPDDFGAYTKFNYKRTDGYTWRVPHTAAAINRGFLSNSMDDRANYSYGEKEIWYLLSIETKTHVAIFNTSNRFDGLGATQEELTNLNSSFMGLVPLQKLYNIQLYTIEQFNDVSLLNLKSDAIPVKEVYFEYSYDLCSNVPNNVGTQPTTMHPLNNYFSGYNRAINANKGKLTLHKVYFTYGNSSKGQLNPYLFEYALNADYKFKAEDRWGTYAPFKDGSSNDICDNYKSVIEYPYTEQGNKSKADQNAAMWSLSSIYLPSGSKISVEYEADDYAYVQDKHAMQMTKVLGFASTSNITTIGQPQSLFATTNGDCKYLFFDIDDSKGIDDYIDPGDNYLSFKMLVNLINGKKEFVYGNVEIVSRGVKTIGTDKVAWVELKMRNVAGKDVNPVRITTFDFIRVNMPWLVYGGEDLMNSGTDHKDVMAELTFSAITDIRTLTGGIYKVMYKDDYGASITTDYSYIRLKNPSGFKYGGGHRVKSIKMKDNWNAVSGESDHTYGQVFDYTVNEGTKIISSGVASYEPLLGGEEIPQRQAVPRRISLPLATDYVLYDDLPVCEDLYPGAVIGYSRVVARNLKPSDLGGTESITRHGTGTTEYNFYTAKDFPTRSHATKLDKYISSSLVLNFIGVNITKAIASQGFSVELNDMHGKPKSFIQYNENGSVISGSEFFYRTDPSNHNLVNTINVLNQDGTVELVEAGVDIETVVEPIQSEEMNITAGVQANLDGFIMGIIPAVVPTALPVWEYQDEQVKTVTATKIIQKYGILESVRVTQNGSTLETKNLAWDGETGDVLLTANETQYGDYDYDLTIPAHFAYEGMDAAYKNIQANFLATVDGNGEINIAAAGIAGILTKGDELLVADVQYPASGNLYGKAWVLDINTTGVALIDERGSKYSAGNFYFKVIRSGHRNMQAEEIGNILMTQNPISGGRYDSYAVGNTNNNAVINAGAVEYSDRKMLYPFKDTMQFKKCDGTLTGYTVSKRIADANYDFNAFGYGTASISGVINPLNRFLPCKTAAVCNVNYVNPYALGILGSFYPFRSLMYYDKANPERTTSANLASATPDFNQTKAASDGLLGSFTPFWNVSSGYWGHMTIDDQNNTLGDKWTWTNQSQMVDQNGNEIQSLNALNINSAAQYGYNRRFPVAVAENATHSHIIFDGFEEYSTNGLYSCPPASYVASATLNQYNNSTWHWQLWPNLTIGRAQITSSDAHSGKQSLALGVDAIEIPFALPQEPSYPTFTGLMRQYWINTTNSVQGFFPNNTNGSGDFVYLLNCWAKYDKTIVNPLFQLQYFNTATSSWTNIPTSQTNDIVWVDGWARKTIEITVPTGVSNQKMRLLILKGIIDATAASGYKLNATSTDLSAGNANVLIDDIRIMPKLANMKCYVYDNVLSRLMAELDAEHYATFYEYDDEGKLIRTKKETERGIMTISESRQNIHKQ